MNQQKLTIAELLRKHMDASGYGAVTDMARSLCVPRQRFYEWRSGKVIPRHRVKMTVVDYLRSKNAIPEGAEVL